MIITTKEGQEALAYVKANIPFLYKFYEFVDSKAKWSGKASNVYFINFSPPSYGWRDVSRHATKELQFRFKNSDDIHGHGIRVDVELLSGDTHIFKCRRDTQPYGSNTIIEINSLDPNCSFDEIEKFIDAGLKHYRKLAAKNNIKQAAQKIEAMSYQSRLIDAIPEDAELKHRAGGENIYGTGDYPSSIYIKKLKTKDDTFTIKFSGTFNMTEEQLIEFVKGFASGYPKKKV